MPRHDADARHEFAVPRQAAGDLRRFDDLIAEPEPAAGDPNTPGPAAASVTTAEPPHCATRTHLYRAGELLEEGFPAAELSERLATDEDAVVWLDLYDPT